VDKSPFARERNDWTDSATDDRLQTGGADPRDAESMSMSESSVERMLADGSDTVETPGRDARQPLSTFGRSLVFKGELVAEEDLLIQGRVEGAIKHNAANLTIGPFADVRADIVARHVLVQGKVVGDVRASESVIVEPSANVRGDICAPRIGLREGAKFKGRIDMDFDDAKDAPSRK